MIRKVIIVVVVLILALVIIQLISCGREHSKRIACAHNLQNIGTSVKIYTKDIRSKRTLEQLIASDDIPTEVLPCPSSGFEKCNYVIVPLIPTECPASKFT